MLKHFLLLGYSMLCGILLCYGQENPTPITLHQLLELVRQHAPSLQTDAAALAIRESQIKKTANNRSPDLYLSYQTNLGSNNNVAGPYFGFGIVPTNNRGVRESNNYQPVSSNLGIAAFQWEFANFGAYRAQRAAAEGDLAVEANKFAQAQFDLQSFTIYSYLQLLKLTDLSIIQQRSIERNVEIHRSILALAKSGIRAGVDTSMAEAALSQARLQQIDLKNQENQLKIRIAAVSGLQVQEVIPDTAAEHILFQQVTALPATLQETNQHPLINYYQSIVANQELKEDLVRKSYRPKLFLSAAVWGRASSVNSVDEFLPLNQGIGMQRGNYLVGLGISYNLFDRRRQRLDLALTERQTMRASKKLAEEQVNVQTNILQAKAEVSAAEERLHEIPRQVKAANAAYRQKFSLYKNGLTDIVELNVAQNMLYRAETDYITAKYNYYLALFHQVIAQNNVDPFLQLFN
ncbi:MULTISPECIES: TolC family protein [Olivibacter]|jgi:outer membrane protein TolC|uniref:TolC family protein n=1 Tax=Olivibacter oleidegradans TaxID=760123 RepID=A0ABV6HMS4_9SPHI|nr:MULTISPECIES: TolC family protein [Olivibacter]MDX3915441.1 TolC family protein [Pseudosphingobacterium sp.]QEL02914.1 TolC family protein [Olivibacter sp. LS-1]